MSVQLIPLSTLLSQINASEQLFLADVIQRDQNPDGTDNGIVRRMQNATCRACLIRYKEKYPNKPFKIKCQGIYDRPEYEAMQEKLRAEGDDMPIEEIREIYDPAFWASRNMVVKNDHGDIVPFIPRWYQEEILRCTAPRKVDRMGRGTGKTVTAIAEEMHQTCIKKKNYIIVVCPAQAQAEMWYQEILFQVENSPALRDSILQKKQQPYYYFRFGNGSVIAIFTAGSKSGRGADAIRGQSPRRIRLDEQDYLVDKDYQAIMPLLRRFKNSTFHGSSTPTGFRQMYWQMCMKFTEYREFFFPITVHPDWNPEMQEACIQEAKTMDRYRHEFLAEFGDPASGVFKAAFVDEALVPYRYLKQIWSASRRYFMGIDWNGKGTGTRICVIEYDPETKKRRKVAEATIDREGATTRMSISKIVELNRNWHCEEIYIDAGFGFAQDELIKLTGATAGKFDVDTQRLKHIKTIDFGANLEFNRLVPNRDPESKYLAKDDERLKRRTKPFMVEGTVMAFEMNLVEISADDTILEEQIRGYRVKSWSKHGFADTYDTDAESGDHNLDAFMLAMLAIEMKYGLWHTKESIRRLAQIAHVTGWGMPAVAMPSTQARGIVAGSIPTEVNLESKRQIAGVPARAKSKAPSIQDQAQARIAYLMRSGAYMVPANSDRMSSAARVPSRTGVFQPRTSRTQGHETTRRRM